MFPYGGGGIGWVLVLDSGARFDCIEENILFGDAWFDTTVPEN